jgi:hypothetical protein
MQTQDAVCSHLREAILAKYGTLTKFADKNEVSLQYISNVLGGQKAIPDWMLKKFKVEHVVTEHWVTQ